ncbi:MAG: transporter substrate-binding domain-containing protein [Bacteroidetes bacterium]|nr:MAG: transporter substrate-binding domain-containing protein [Bacteroidota bacterium]
MFEFDKNIFKQLLVITLIIILSSSLSAQPRKKILRYGADATSGAPYVFQDPKNMKHLIGFEVDIINEIAKDLGWKARHVQNEWDGLIPGLDRNDYDVAINGIEITEDRMEAVNFSIPYYMTYEQLVVRRDQEGIGTLSDLVGKAVGTLDGSLAERILKAKGGIDVRPYDEESNSYKDLEYGRLDAVLIDEPVAKYYAGWNPSLKLTGQPIGEVTYGIVLKKSDTLLLAQINKSINRIKKSGKLREILESWNMWNFMMAGYIDDHKESNIPHTYFNEYMESQGKKTTFMVLLKRYIGFMPMIGEGTLVTIGISILAMLVAVTVGLFVVLLRVYSPQPFSGLAVMFIEGIRGTPLLIQLYFIFYALPSVGVKISPFVAGVIGLGLNYGAYEAENYRAGIFSVQRGQMEAAISLGMTRNQALRHIILPQAIRFVIPPMTNDFISLLKDSSLVSVITMVELTKVYQQISNTYFDFIGTGLLIAGIYLLIGLPFVKLAKLAERKFTVDKRKIIKR